jgi:exodeoxyribonuclease-5
VTDKRLTVADLSPDQREVFDSMLGWTECRVIDNANLLTVGGLAGCLSGDTIVKYNRGARINSRPITLRDLYLKFNGFAGSGRGSAQRWTDLTMPTYMPSLWPDGSVSGNRIVAVFESGVKKVVRLDFTGGHHLVLTEDHPIAVPGGEFVKAGELSKGDIVLAQGSMISPRGQGRRADLRPPRVILTLKYHPTGPRKTTWCNGIAYDYARVARARLVVEAEMNSLPYDEYVHCLKHNAGVSAGFKTLPRLLDVHHIDEDTLNDDISNLEVLPKAEHARIHSPEHVKHFKKDFLRELKVVRRQRAGEEMTYDVQMEPPANNFVANGVFVHNTGKTTLLGVFAATTDLLVAYVTFTGRASSILSRKLKAAGAATTDKMRPPEGMKVRGRALDLYDPNLEPDSGPSFVGTIHRLLYSPVVDSSTEELVGWRKRAKLDRAYDLIVIDEASQVGDNMLSDLKVHGVPILAVGDHGQLPPVMDAGDLMKNPDLRLEKIHRQAEGNPIITLAHSIRQTGRLGETGGRYGNDGVVRFRRKPEAAHIIGEAFSASRGGGSFLDVGILCWTNRSRVALNATARKALGFSGPPKKGEVVIALKNKPPVYNGMRGVLTADGQPADGHCMRDPAPVGCCAGPGRCDCECNTCDNPIYGKRPWLIGLDVEFPDEGLSSTHYEACAPQFCREKLFSSVEELKERGMPGSFASVGSMWDFGFAMTGHKAQGSSFQHAIVYVDRPIRPDDDDFRRWAYTCVTRASERLTVLI